MIAVDIRNLSLVAAAALVLALSACGGGSDGPVTGGDDMMPGDGDSMMPEPEPEPEPEPDLQALANAVGLVANDGRLDEDGEHVGSWLYRAGSLGGTPQSTLSYTHRDGGYAQVIVSHDDNGHLQHNVGVWPVVPLQEADPWITALRYINTNEAPEELEGVTKSARAISDHGLGAVWQVTELTADYDNGGTLEIYVATDAQPSDGSLDPFQTSSGVVDDNIELSGVPALPADKDFIIVWISDGDSIDGSLDGVTGSFSCANVAGCGFFADRDTATEGYYAGRTGISFTPVGGSAQPLASSETDTVPRADYLAFGHWLYVPEDVTDTANYEFGVLASGGDPFEPGNLAGLTGTATYEGDAVGMYYVDGLTDSPTVGSFTADVALTADFGDSDATGFIDGEVRNFEFEGDVASSLPTTVALTRELPSPYYNWIPEGFGVEPGSTNVFDTAWQNNPVRMPGGQVDGMTNANVDGESWYGHWTGVFYGNGAEPTDHPASVVGVFGSFLGRDDGNRSDAGLAGAFGAHRQEQ